MEHVPRKPHGTAIYSDPWLSLWADDDGLGYLHCEDGVLVVPLTDDGRVLLAQERSPAFDRDVLVLAGGEAQEGERLEETANRELQEELGWRAERIDYLGELYPFKYLDTRQYVFLARDLVPSKLEGDEHHLIRVRAIALGDWPDLCARGELHDAPTIAALSLAERRLESENT